MRFLSLTINQYKMRSHLDCIELLRTLTGTDVAAALVTGVIVYLLSLRDLDGDLRTSETLVPFSMKWFLRTNSKQYFGLPAIWNQLPAA